MFNKMIDGIFLCLLYFLTFVPAFVILFTVTPNLLDSGVMGYVLLIMLALLCILVCFICANVIHQEWKLKGKVNEKSS